MLNLLSVFPFEKCTEATEPMQSGSMSLCQGICLKGITIYDTLITMLPPLFALILLYCCITLILAVLLITPGYKFII